jgi:hypothetical protein
MPYTTSTLDDGRIILMIMDEKLDFQTEFVQLILECTALLDAATDGAVVIVDGRLRPPNDLNDILQGANVTRTPEGKAMFQHPNLRKILTITTSKALHMTLKGLNSATFGFLEITVFDTPEAAINAAREVLYGHAKAN